MLRFEEARGSNLNLHVVLTTRKAMESQDTPRQDSEYAGWERHPTNIMVDKDSELHSRMTDRSSKYV